MSTLTTFPKSYLYGQYDDDPDLQALVAAFNLYAQAYLDKIVGLNLPIYTGGQILGDLLDWVGQGIYGISRPYLTQQQTQASFSGTYNSFLYNQVALNSFVPMNPAKFEAVTDDIYKRVITWSFFKGDGKYFTIRWLKRRAMRFLFGQNGIDPPVNETYPISVIFGTNNSVIIRIPTGIRKLTGGSLYNMFGYNKIPYMSYTSSFTPLPPIANAVIFQEAIQANVLPLPFQYQFSVQIG